MAWGLDGLQLSDEIKAFAANSGGSDNRFWDWILGLIDGYINDNMQNPPQYDFYNTQAEAIACGLEGTTKEYFPYNGYNFCKKIIAKANESTNADHHIGALWLSESPKSAVEYCYNKNKRNNSGIVTETDLKWYLPAIDEIQDITSAAYGEFDGVFQENFYWSSQPAYKMASWKSTIYWLGFIPLSGSGYLYYDNVNYARATSAKATGANDFTYEPSRMTASNESWTFYENSDPTIVAATSTTTDAGYKSRTNVKDYCRVRAVYRSGVGSKDIGN